jgi:hypothetical protein
MTRKDYELIAGVIRDLKRDQRERGAFAHNPDLMTVASWLADELESTNPRFDRVKFLQASGVC